MNTVKIELNVSSLAAAQKFYCDELALFDLHKTFGDEAISLVFKECEYIFLELTQEAPDVRDRLIATLGVKNFTDFYNRLKVQRFENGGNFIDGFNSGEIIVKDPSGNTLFFMKQK